MTREEQIREAGKHQDSDSYFGFIEGARWADEQWKHDHAVMKEALEFYASDKAEWSGAIWIDEYDPNGTLISVGEFDMGEIAREALAKLKVKNDLA